MLSNLKSMCKEMTDQGILIVAAAGNVCQGIAFPSSFDDVISVGAVDKCCCRYEKSAIAPTVDISAPGCSVFTTTIRSEGRNYQEAYTSVNGTSIAAPIVTGTLALAIAYLKYNGKPYASKDLRIMLRETAHSLEDNPLILSEAQKVIRTYKLNKFDPSMTPQKAMPWIYGAGIVRADRLMEKITQTF